LEAALNLLSNPIALKMGLVLFAAVFSFAMAVLIIRRMRRSLSEDSVGSQAPTSIEQLPLHTYHAVIQQLKQQKHELIAQQQAEQRRAKTSENVSTAILSNLSSGVVFFGPNGLVRQANQAAKAILAIASPAGMDATTLFRGASLVDPPEGLPNSVAEAIHQVIQGGETLKRVEAYYLTPSGDSRVLDLNVSQVRASDAALLGAACLIDDRSQIAGIRRQIELRGELSAEMALALRNSLVSIAGYAQQLAQNRDPELAQQLASDIADEANHLDRTIGGFLAGKPSRNAAANGL
jgi:nitrogen fixation/metabolism regulation signal transduction histidine kinase